MTDPGTLLTQPLVTALGWALIHFIWQGTFVAILLAGVLRMIRGMSTNARYATACAALMLMLLAPLATMAIIMSNEPGKTTNRLSPLSATRPVPQPPAVEIEPAVNLAQTPNVTTLQRSWSSVWSVSFLNLLPWMILLWLSGVACFSLRLIGGWLYTRRLRHYGTRPLEETWRQALHQLCRQLRVTRPVRVLESVLVNVPMVIGWLRPVILLPVGALSGLTPQQLEAIIAHELAHIRRHDYLINLLQALVETLLFYHPAVWWVSRRIRQEREHCCDDLAVAVCGDALTYARALLEMEQLRAGGPHLALAANGGSLMNRIQRLVGAQPQQTNRFTGLVVFMIALIAVVSFGVGAQNLLPSSKRDNSNTGRQMLIETRLNIKQLDHSTMRSEVGRLDHSEIQLEVGQLDHSEIQSEVGQLDHREIQSEVGQLNRYESPLNDEQKLLSAEPGNFEGGAAEKLKALSSTDPMERAAAACSLGKLGAVEAIPSLINMLGDDTPIQPIKCWDSGNWSPAIHTFKQASPGEQAAIALASLSQPAIEPLIAALSNGNHSMRRNAAWAIGEIRGGGGRDRSAAVEPLIVALSDGDAWVRRAAAFSLGELRPRQATESLIAALGDAELSVREMSAWALGEMRAVSGVGSLTTLLLHDENERVRRKAAWALGEIRDPRALDALNIALNDQERSVRATAKWAISEIRD
ncbi:MAG TPA: M56 family metallopeptidase [Blastocatellia bacterium]|nr:M56 family metallopeptidase [Blastocatellia bacterium]